MDRICVMQLVRSLIVGEITRRTFLKRATAAVGTLAAANMLLAACEAYPTVNPPPVVDEEATPATVEEGAMAAGASMVDYPGAGEAPVMGLYGTEDRGIPVEGVKAMEEGLAAAGIENEIYIYDGAQHAFFNDTRASSYDAEASAAAWERTLGWFERYLQGC